VSRGDDERVSDILDAATQIGALVADGKESWTWIGFVNSPQSGSWRSSASVPER
jgi:hypothetical protein